MRRQGCKAGNTVAVCQARQSKLQRVKKAEGCQGSKKGKAAEGKASLMVKAVERCCQGKAAKARLLQGKMTMMYGRA